MIEAYPLCWPDGIARTPAHSRAHSHFKVGHDAALRNLREEVRMIGGKDLIVSTNIRVRRDGMPYSQANTDPADPGVAIYFDWRGSQRAMACDRYDRLWKNAQALALCIDSLRALERHGSIEILDRAFRGFAALPSGIVTSSWSSVLGVSNDATEEEIRAAYRALALQAHPDRGGSDDQMAALNAALDDALRCCESTA